MTPLQTVRTALLEDGDFFLRCGRVGLLLFAFGLFSSTFLVSVGKVLLLVGVAGGLKRDGNLLIKDALFWVVVSFSIFLLWLSFHVQTLFPGTLPEQMEGTKDYCEFLFLALGSAFLLGRSPRVLRLLPAAVIVGLFAGILFHFHEVSWAGWPLNRPGFGMPFNAFGLYCAVVLLGLILMAPRLFGEREGPLYTRPRFWIWLCAVVLSLNGLILSLSRGAWIACLLVYPLALFGYYLRARRTRSVPSLKSVLLNLAIPLCILGIVLLAYAPQVLQRVNDDREVITRALTTSFTYRPATFSSSGTRVFLWQEGVERWTQRPWTGWGPRRTLSMIEPLWDKYPMDKARDFHNSYIEVLVRMGGVGFLFLAAAAALVLRSWWRGMKSGSIPDDLAFFVLGALLLFAVGTATNDRMDRMGRAFLSLFLGMAYSYRLQTTRVT